MVSSSIRSPIGRIALLGGMIVLIPCTGKARADIIPDLTNVTQSLINSADFTFNYDSSVTIGQTVKKGDYFTIYDFSGYVAGTAYAPTGWTLITGFTGLTPPTTLPTDNPNIINLTWEYTGTKKLGTGTAPADLGQFGADSTYGQVHDTFFTGLATKYDPGQRDNGTPIANIGTVGAPSPAPEPSGMAMLASTGMLGWTWRRRRARKA